MTDLQATCSTQCSGDRQLCWQQTQDVRQYKQHLCASLLPSSLHPYFPASLHPCLPASLPLYLPASLPPCIPTSLHPCLPASLSPCLPSRLPASLPASPPDSLPTSRLPPYLPASLPFCFPAALPSYSLRSRLNCNRYQTYTSVTSFLSKLHGYAAINSHKPIIRHHEIKARDLPIRCRHVLPQSILSQYVFLLTTYCAVANR